MPLIFAAIAAGGLLALVLHEQLLGGEMKLSDAGLVFISTHEGFSAELYNDASGTPNTTIGYGHLVHHGPIDGSESLEFQNGITHQRALQLLREDAADAESTVNSEVSVTLTQAQFDALVDFVFNVGAGNFRRSSVLSEVNAGNFQNVGNALALWNKAGGIVLAGLTTRREQEGEAFG